MCEDLLTIWQLVLHIGIPEMIVLHFSLQGEDMIEHTIDICHVFAFCFAKGKIILSMLITILMCSHRGIQGEDVFKHTNNIVFVKTSHSHVTFFQGQLNF